MRIVLSIDSFKGSLTSKEAADAAKDGILSICPQAEVLSVPIADGGEGTVEALVDGMGGELRTVTIHGPLYEPVEASYGFLPESHTAIIEMASAAGLAMVPAEKRNPLVTTTYGVGELIRHAVESGVRHFIIGIGGSATHDCGVGMLQALGWRFRRDGKRCTLSDAEIIDEKNVMPELAECTFQIACDVTNPLYGENGAAEIYAPQKGADAHMVKQLDEASRRFAELYEKSLADTVTPSLPGGASRQNSLQESLSPRGLTPLHNICTPSLPGGASHPGAGAAGGLGFAFLTFLRGELCSGIQLIMEETELEEKIQSADLVITGEGRIDVQTAMGKAPAGVASLCQKHGVPAVMIAGDCAGVSAVNGVPCFSILRSPMTLAQAMDREIARKNMTETAAAITAAFIQIKMMQ